MLNSVAKQYLLLLVATFTGLCLLSTHAPLAYGASIPSTSTMRVDYLHSGNSTQEMMALERISIEPLPWSGHPSQYIDSSNLGKYLFEIKDPTNNTVLFSRGFCSVYGEWETTAEANGLNRGFEESIRFPTPLHPVNITIKKRDNKNRFQPIWTFALNPADPAIHKGRQVPPAKLIAIEKNGNPTDKVDFLILGDGYTSAESRKFEKDVRRLVEVLFSVSPFKEHRKDFNIWALCPPATETGISRPSTGVHRASPLGTTYDAFGVERYVLTFDNNSLRRTAQFATYEFVEIITNTKTYGGGGIQGLYGTVAADSAQADYVFVHEFGHHFAGLADEYYTSPVAYQPLDSTNRVEPWEPNVTAFLDSANLKWKSFLTPNAPLPTPWPKEPYEAYARDYSKRRATLRAENRPESEMEALFREKRKFEVSLFSQAAHNTAVGLFEGANYEAKGFYRSQMDCMMFTQSKGFCMACRRAIENTIKQYSSAGR